MKVRYEGLALMNGREKVFDGLSLRIPSGTIACFYGPTGSGKTSLLLATGGFMRISAGEVFVGGTSVRQHPHAARRLTGLGLIPGFNPLVENLSIRENLFFQCRLYQVAAPARRVLQLLQQFDLEGAAAKWPDALTQPETLRAGLAMAMVHDPAVLLVDEPSHALTSQELAEAWRYLERLKAEGKTLILSSHSLWVAHQSDLAVKLPQGKEVPADEYAALGLAGHQEALA